MNILRASARSLLAAPFLVDGFDAIRNPTPHAQKVRRVWSALEPWGAPILTEGNARLISRLGGVIGVGAASCLALGKCQRSSAALLAATTIPLAVVNAPLWLARDTEEKEESRRKATGYGVLFAGLVFAAVDREGKPSFSWRRYYAKHEREAIRAIKAEVDAS